MKKETENNFINRNIHASGQLTNGVNSGVYYYCISSNNTPQDNIKVDPLRFDTLVDFFETREFNVHQVKLHKNTTESDYEPSNKGGFINQSRIFNAKNGKLHRLKSMTLFNKVLHKIFQIYQTKTANIRMRRINH